MNKRNPKILFRADGNSTIGLGHVVRSLALAEMLHETFDCVFAIQEPSTTLEKQINAVCTGFISLPLCAKEETGFISELDSYLAGNEIVVLDGYAFATDYQKHIKSKGCTLVCIDDIHAYHFVADAVINHIGGLTTACFSAEPYTTFFLGMEYALLRKQFREASRKYKADLHESQNSPVLICMGGADPANETLRVLKKCVTIEPANNYIVVTGSAYRYKSELDVFIASTSCTVSLLRNISADELIHYMRLCKMAVTAASTIAYEYLSVRGLLYLNMTASNQTEVYKHLIETKMALPFEKFSRPLSQEIHEELIGNSSILDGLQQSRYLNIFKQFSYEPA